MDISWENPWDIWDTYDILATVTSTVMGIEWEYHTNIQHDVFFVIMILSHVSKRDLKKKKENQCPIYVLYDDQMLGISDDIW